jgi:hypothetical protein
MAIVDVKVNNFKDLNLKKLLLDLIDLRVKADFAS